MTTYHLILWAFGSFCCAFCAFLSWRLGVNIRQATANIKLGTNFRAIQSYWIKGLNNYSEIIKAYSAEDALVQFKTRHSTATLQFIQSIEPYHGQDRERRKSGWYASKEKEEDQNGPKP